MNRYTLTNTRRTFPNSADVLWPSAHALVSCRSPQIHHICNYRKENGMKVKRERKKKHERLTQHCSQKNTVCTVPLRHSSYYCPFKNISGKKNRGRIGNKLTRMCYNCYSPYTQSAADISRSTFLALASFDRLLVPGSPQNAFLHGRLHTCHRKQMQGNLMCEI